MLRLAYFRTRAKLSQAELARRSGISQSAISKIEAGKRAGVDLRTLELLAKALKLDHPGELLTWAPRGRGR
jgi:transcriptional regulator with XRE-family HTH domain